MTELPSIVLDATVATKWHLRDEEHRSFALAARENMLADRVRLIAPSQLRFEVAAALLKATRNPDRRYRLDFHVAEISLEEFQSWPITYIPSETVAFPAFRLARRFGCSYYDALYIALAEATGSRFLHADNKLRNALSDRFPLALWIEDYHSLSH